MRVKVWEMLSVRLFALGVALGMAMCDVGSQPQVLLPGSVKRKEGRQSWRVNQMPEIRCCETFSRLIPTSKDISKARLQS